MKIYFGKIAFLFLLGSLCKSYGQEGYQNDILPKKYATNSDPTDMVLYNNGLILSPIVTGLDGGTTSSYSVDKLGNVASLPFNNIPFLSGDYNVNQYTGTGSYGIPLYNVQTDNVSVPVGLMYDASGVKVRQYASEVGLGWNLAYGPTLIRIVRDKDDFTSNTIFNQCEENYLYGTGPENAGCNFSVQYTVNGNSCYRFLKEAVGFAQYDIYAYCSGLPCCNAYNVGTYCANYPTAGACRLLQGLYYEKDNNQNGYIEDHMSDLYIANLNGDIIKFMWDKPSRIFKILNTNKNYKIAYNYVSTRDANYGSYIKNFTITNDNGISFVFGEIDPALTIANSTLLESTVSAVTPSINVPNHATVNYYSVTGWKVKEITSPYYVSNVVNPTYNKISFKYTSKNIIKVEDDVVRVTWMYEKASQDGTVYNMKSNVTLNSYQIDEITYPSGKVSFTLGNRYDYGTEFKAITKVEIKDLNQNLIKSFSLNYDYFAPYANSAPSATSGKTAAWCRNNLRLKLLGLVQTNLTDNSQSLSYTFSYDETKVLPSRNSYIEDHWGYSNMDPAQYAGQVNIAFLPPTLSYFSSISPSYTRLGSYKEPDASLMGSFVLNKIIQPLKGSIEIAYGPHYYYSYTRLQNKMAGGLRVEAVQKKDSKGIVKSYSYQYLNKDGFSSGVLQDDKLYIKVIEEARRSSSFPSITCSSNTSCNQGYVLSSSSILPVSPHAQGNTVCYRRVVVSETGNGSQETNYHSFPIFYNYQYTMYRDANICWDPYQLNIPTRGVADISKYYSYVVLKEEYSFPPEQGTFTMYPTTIPNASFSENIGLATNDPNNGPGSGTTNIDPNFYCYYLKNGLIKKESVYKEGSFLPLSSTNYSYSIPVSYPMQRLGELLTEESPTCSGTTTQKTIYKYFIPIASFYPISKTEASYDAAQNSLSSTVNYLYDSKNHPYPTRVYSSKGDDMVKGVINIYPQDYGYVPSGTGLSSDALAINSMIAPAQSIPVMLNTPIEQVTFLAPKTSPTNYSTYLLLDDNINTFKIQTRQSVPASSFIAPVATTKVKLNRVAYSNSTFGFKFSNRTTNNVDPFGTAPSSFQNYLGSANYAFLKDSKIVDAIDDWGKVKQSHVQYDINNTQIWGYANELCIANVIGASSDQVAYTSFEEQNSGGWIHAFPNDPQADAISGKQYYKNTMSPCFTSFSLPVLTNGSYRVSFYARSSVASSVNIQVGTSIVSVTIPASSNWAYYSADIAPTAFGVASLTPSSTSLQLDELRLCPKNSKMITKTYLPEIGISTSVDENGIPTYYEYDGLGRIKNIRNQDGNIVKHYDYHVKN